MSLELAEAIPDSLDCRPAPGQHPLPMAANDAEADCCDHCGLNLCHSLRSHSVQRLRQPVVRIEKAHQPAAA